MTCIDGIGPFLAEHDSFESAEVGEAFRSVFSEGPAVGVEFVVTAGGVLGRISKVGDAHLTLEIAPNVEIQVQRAAVQTVLPKGTIKNP